MSNKNTYPTKELAEASLALCQLLQWRDKVNEGWIPDWKDDTEKFTLLVSKDKVVIWESINIHYPLAFRTSAIRDEFMQDHKDLLEIAKPLI